MKKVLCIILSILMVAGMLAGCGQKADTKPAAQGTEAAQGNAAANSGEEPYEVHMMIALPATAPDSAALERVMNAVNAITLPKLNMTLKLEVMPFSMYLEQVPLQLSSGASLDIFTAFSAMGPAWVNAGYLLDLTDLMAEYGKDIPGTYSSPELATVCNLNGFLYGLPVHKETCQQPTMFFRTDILEKHNLDVSNIRTLADVDALFEKVSQLEPDMWMVAADNTAQGKTVEADFIGGSTITAGLLLNRDNTEVVEIVGSEEFREWCDYHYKWYTKGWINSGAASDTESYYSYIKSGQAFSFFSDYGHPLSLTDQQANCSGTPLTMVQLDTPYCTTNSSAVFCYSIGAGSKDPAKAMTMLNEIMTSTELMNLLNWGVEGEDYVVNADGLLDFPEGKDASTVGYHLDAGWILPNQFKCTPWCTSDADIYDQFMDYNATAVNSPALGFRFDPDPVSDIVSAVSNVRSKYYKALIVGAVDPAEYIPKYLEELDAAGNQELIAEIQRQLDEWLASKG